MLELVWNVELLIDWSEDLDIAAKMMVKSKKFSEDQGHSGMKVHHQTFSPVFW